MLEQIQEPAVTHFNTLYMTIVSGKNLGILFITLKPCFFINKYTQLGGTPL